MRHFHDKKGYLHDKKGIFDKMGVRNWMWHYDDSKGYFYDEKGSFFKIKVVPGMCRGLTPFLSI